jgi:chaperonin GroEL
VKVLHGRQALEVLARGMREVSQLVATTYGPNGAKVLVSRMGKPVVTTDGSSLARELKFRGLERIGVALARSASSKVDEGTGDGTSTSLILASAIVDAALDTYTARTWSPVLMVQDIEGILPLVVELVESLAQPPTPVSLRRVALMASHGDDLVTDKVVEAIQRVGEKGTVLISPGDGTGIETDYRDGLVLDVGWASHSLGLADGTPHDMEGPLVAVVDARLKSFEDVRTMMEEASTFPGRDLVLFCRDVTDAALSTILLNIGKRTMSCMAVAFRGPDALDQLEDIAAATNAKLVTPSQGDDLRTFQKEWLGYARKVKVGKGRTEVLSYPDAEDRIAARVKELTRLAEGTSFDYDRDRYMERAAAMDGGLCILKVGGYTEAEGKERRFRAEDTLHAARMVLRTGVVPGAGRALHFVSQQPALQLTPGGRVMARALEEPMRVLCARSGTPFERVNLPSDMPWWGWCPVRNWIHNFEQDPIVADPTGVVLASLRTAVSVACEVIQTEVVITATPPMTPRR